MIEKKKKSHEFEILMAYISRMQTRYFRALIAFYTFERLCELTAPNIVSELDAKKNVMIINQYRYFFVPTKEALRVHFFLELAKLFDSSNESLHIDKIINFTNSNIKHLTADAFEEYNKSKSRKFIEELVEKYKNIDQSDLNSLKNMINEQKVIIKKLRTYRDKWIAHDQTSKISLPKISSAEVKILFKIIQKILNTISGKLNSESWIYPQVKFNAKRHVSLVIDRLGKFESYRLKELIKSKKS